MASVADRKSCWRKSDPMLMNKYQENASCVDSSIFDQLTNPGAANSGAANPQLILDDIGDSTGHTTNSLGNTNVVILKRPQTTSKIDSSHALVLQEGDANEEDTDQEGDADDEKDMWDTDMRAWTRSPQWMAGSQRKTVVIGGQKSWSKWRTQDSAIIDSLNALVQDVNVDAATQSQKLKETPSESDIPLEKGGTCPVVCRLPEESTPNPYVQPKGGTPSEFHIPLEKGEMHLVVHSLLEENTSNQHALLEESTPNSYVQPKGGTQSNLIVSFKRTTLTNFCFLLKGTKSYRHVLFHREIRHGLYFQPKRGTPFESDIPLEKKRTKSHRDVVFGREICHDSYVQLKGGTVPFRIADLRLRFNSTRLIFAFSLFCALAFFVTIRCTNSDANFAAALSQQHMRKR